MISFLVACLAAAGFLAGSLLALPRRDASGPIRACATAVAAGILLAVAFGDLLPESLEKARVPAIAGFLCGFAFLFLSETFTHSHTHHSPEEHVGRHAIWPFAFGLGVHNLVDGFVLAVAAAPGSLASAAVGLGILVHQVPVGISLAAVLVAANASRGTAVVVATALALAIPLAATLAFVLPEPGDATLGAMLGTAGGALTYVSAAHLLPEVQSEKPSRTTAAVFAVTLLAATALLLLLPDY